MSDKHHNLNCAHAAELVSYLYDEIGKTEKAVFESHLANCLNCADELADFSFARHAVKDWRDAEFTHLKTPVFEIPFETHRSTRTLPADTGSLLDNLRRIFSLRPVWATSAAALAIIIGLFLTTNFFQPDFTVEKEKVNSDDNTVLSTVKSDAQSQFSPFINPESTNSFALSEKPANKSFAAEKREIVRQNRAAEKQKNSVLKASVNTPKIKDVRESGENIAASDLKNSSNPTRKNLTRANRPVPTLNSFEEEEDDTLRLAEIFEEVDSGK